VILTGGGYHPSVDGEGLPRDSEIALIGRRVVRFVLPATHQDVNYNKFFHFSINL